MKRNWHCSGLRYPKEGNRLPQTGSQIDTDSRTHPNARAHERLSEDHRTLEKLDERQRPALADDRRAVPVDACALP
jgi:hypothetical protein